MPDREEGWYWVKRYDEWTPHFWCWESDSWWDPEEFELFVDEVAQKVGPRIPTPEELENSIMMPRFLYELLFEKGSEERWWGHGAISNGREV